MNYPKFKAVMKLFPLFSVQEIKKNFPGFDSRRLVEWQKKGYIKKLRNRYYCFSDKKIDESFLYYTANELYRPSYVSMESALSYYGFIPEGVFQITSCSTLKTNSFNTPVSKFSYRHIKPVLFFGYKLISKNNYRYAIAEPEKTLIDYLYLHSEITEIADIRALRWNASVISNSISMDVISRYDTFIDSPALTKRLSILKSFLNVNT